MRWRLDLPLQDPPLTCDGCSEAFMVEHACSFKKGGGGFQFSGIISLTSSGSDICGIRRIPPAAVIRRTPKYMGFAETGRGVTSNWREGAAEDGFTRGGGLNPRAD